MMTKKEEILKMIEDMCEAHGVENISSYFIQVQFDEKICTGYTRNNMLGRAIEQMRNDV